MATTENTTVQEDHQYHYYTGSKIPWYVHLIWILFWGFATYYIVSFLLPAAGTELVSPP